MLQIYQCPTDDETVAEINRSLNEAMPFTVIASNEVVNVDSKMVRGREYPWGIVVGMSDSR